jgi:hypothetical protein
MENIFALEPSLAIPSGDSYIASYPYLCAHFVDKATIDEADVVLGAHMVYGWMPTVLGLDTGAMRGFSLAQAATLLTTAKRRDLNKDELLSLKGLVNNSIVGASKLLHFIEPTRYPIWDSRLYRFRHGRDGHDYQVNCVNAYLAYRRELMVLMSDTRFPAFHAAVNVKVGYPVTGLRALELMMFLAAPPRERKPKKLKVLKG